MIKEVKEKTVEIIKKVADCQGDIQKLSAEVKAADVKATEANEKATKAIEKATVLAEKMDELENHVQYEAQRTSMRFIQKEAAPESARAAEKVKIIMDLESTTDKQLVEALCDCPDAAKVGTSLKLSSPACATKVESQGKQGQKAFATIQISGATAEEKRANKKELIDKLKATKGVKAVPHRTSYQMAMYKLHSKILSTLQKEKGNSQYIIHQDTLYIRTDESVCEYPVHRHLPPCHSEWDLRKHIKDQQFMSMTPQSIRRFIDDTDLYSGKPFIDSWWKLIQDFNPPKTPRGHSGSRKQHRDEMHSGNPRDRTKSRMNEDDDDAIPLKH